MARGDAFTAPGREPITYAELGPAVREIAGGLAALGIERGDHVAILAATRPEWTLADFGVLGAGRDRRADLPDQLARGVRVRARPLRASARCSARTPSSREDRAGPRPLPGARARDPDRRRGAGGGDARRAARARRRTADAVVAERLASVGPDDVATIVYTSGTTGPPKGCVITHGHLLATVAMYEAELELGDGHW